MRNDRWSTDAEIKSTLRCFTKDKRAAGPVLYRHNGALYVYDKEGHMVILGVSGSGKSRRCTMAMTRAFIESGESFLVIDPKGEIYYETAGAMGDRYDTHVIDFRHIYNSEHWNPLKAPYELFTSGDMAKKQVALEMIDELAHSLYPVSDKGDPFWPESARSVFVAVVLALFEHAPADQVTMASVYQTIAKGEERLGVGTVLKEFVSNLPTNSVAAMLLQSYVSTASDTRAGIRSTFLEGISMFARSEGLIQMLGTDDLHINQLDGMKSTGIFVILPDERPIFDRLAGILCSQIMSHYIRLAQDKYGGKLPLRLNVCLEELGNIGGAISTLPHLMSAGRSRNVRVQCVLQSLSQLIDIYGPSNATTILSNADVMVAFRTNHWDTLTELSRKCGERDVDNGTHTFREPLITQSQLSAMETGQALVMLSGRTKFITWLPDYKDMFDFSNWTPPKERLPKKNSPVTTFDISECTKKIRQNKMEEVIGTNHRPSGLPGFFNQSTETGASPIEDSPKNANELDIDSMLARIDAKIAELETEEGRENKAENIPYDVIVKHCGGHVHEVAREISAVCSIPMTYVEKKLNEGTAKFHLSTKKAAEDVRAKIISLGGTVIIRKATV